MPEKARTDLWEPQGSNPLGPPGPELLHAKTLEAIADRLGVRPEEIGRLLTNGGSLDPSLTRLSTYACTVSRHMVKVLQHSGTVVPGLWFR